MATHKLFFSSCFNDPEPVRLPIRDRVATLNKGSAPDNKPVWLAEDFPLLKPDAPTPPLEKALFCVEGVRQSDVYVAVARERHGSPVAISPQEQVQASYFELELFEAALLRKPAYVFLLKGAEPGDRLAALLRLLAPALPGLCWTPLDEDEIFRRVSEILEMQERPGLARRLRRAESSDRQIANQLTGRRHRIYDPVTEMPNIEFLGGLHDPSISPPEENLVEGILGRVENEQNHQVRLVLIWTAIRELMGAPPDKPGTEKFLPLWDRALSGWTNSGAWYGLHGHPLMGCLGSLSSLTRIRTRIGQSERPHGAMSSEYYSIAKHVGGHLRQAVLTMSRRHIDAAFAEGETSGKLAMRGSIRNAMGDSAGAISDYERVVELRENVEGSSIQERGDGKSELGFVLVFGGQVRRGLACMEEGIALLERGGPSGFVVRAKRKLGRAYLRAGAPRRALFTLAEAHDLAESLGALDQISRIDRLASAIERRLPS